ncbi:hypothetical protein [Alistipes putredinis]|uniref:hypothetical protein n=1 Tax=Alistipes putredinis TaxID=28117 RepID=UPI003A8BCA95
MSIQQSLDGHSFSLLGLESPAAEGVVEVEAVTPRTMLVPREVFEPAAAEALLAAAGIRPAAGERIVWSDPGAETVALMCVAGDAVRQVEERLGDRVRYTSPLLRTPADTASAVWMYRQSGTLYIKVYREQTLRMAEALPAAGEADLLYVAERLQQAFALHEYVLIAAGDDAKGLRRLLGKRFGKSLCE